MKKYKGTSRVYDYWRDGNMMYAVVEWPEEEIKENKSNLFLIVSKYNDYPENI